MKHFLLIGVVVCLICGPAQAIIIYGLDAPQDDMRARSSLTNHAELQVLRAEFEALVERYLEPLSSNDVARILGPKLSQRPTDLVLPIFDSGWRWASGGGGFPTRDMHAIGNLGYAEIFWYHTVYGEKVAAVVFYPKAGKRFVPLRYKEPFPAKLALDSTTAAGLAKWAKGRFIGDGYSERLAWDTARFRAMKEWLIEHVPKPVPLGEVEVRTKTPTRIRLGTGLSGLITFNYYWPNGSSNFAFTLSLAPNEPSNTNDWKSRFEFHGTSSADKPVRFSLDGQMYEMSPKLKGD